MSDCTVWDAVTGKPLPPLAGPEVNGAARGARGVVFSPDGNQLVGADGNTLRTWDVETGTPVLTLRGHVTPIGARSFTPDGKRLWSLEHDGTLKEWDARPPQPLAIRFVAGGSTAAQFAPFAISGDGGRVAALVDVKTDPQAAFAPGVRVWDAAGKSVKTLVPPPRDAGPKSRNTLPHHGVALSRDGRRALLTRAHGNVGAGRKEPAGPPSDLTVWDVETKAVLLHQELESQPFLFAAISPDGRTVAAVDRGADHALAVRLFDVDTRRERAPLTAPDMSGVFVISFSPDGRRLVGLGLSRSVVNRQSTTKLVVWDLEGGSSPRVVESDLDGAPQLSAARIAWSPDGSRFAFAHVRRDDSVVTVYDAATGKPVLTPDQPLARDVPASTPAPLIFSADGTRIRDVPASVPAYLAYSPDGTRIAGFVPARVVGGMPTLKVWDAAGGKELLAVRLPPNANPLGGKVLTFTSDGHLLLAEYVTGPAAGAPSPSTRAVLMTTWGAAPEAGRGPEAP